MFGNLTDKFNDVFRKISGRGKISEANIREAMDEVKTALLEADVHYEVVESFCESVQAKSLGSDVLDSLKPGQQLIKIVHDELVWLMGGKEEFAEDVSAVDGMPSLAAPTTGGIMFVDPGPTLVMMCGLQGAGKTTTCGKLAAVLKKQGKKVMLAAADLQRPAAVHQLEVLVGQVNEEIESGPEVLFYSELDKVAEYGKAVGAAVTVCRHAASEAKKTQCDVLILDTAGRLHVNDDLMGELRQIEKAVGPHQIMLVVDAMTGQDAVNSAKAFNEQLELDGVILTKFDSDTRGGAALSVRQVTGKPIKYLGVGEHLDALETFHPERITSRILGMGDVVSLVEKAQEQVSVEEAQALQEKMAAGKMTMDDFLSQLRTMRKMGSMKSLLGMLPGIGNQISKMDLDEREIDRTEAIIHSMTRDERKDVDLLDNSRRRRISRGSGTEPTDVAQLVKGFGMVSQMGKQMSGMGMLSKMRAMSNMGQMDMSSLAGGHPPQLGSEGRPSTRSGFKKKFKQRKRRK